MNNKSAEWQREYYLTHDKYRMQGQGTDCYKVVKSLTRILQLPTIAKLTTDNESVISDFRLNSGEYGLEPYDEYAIKVDDTYGASLYILVHRRANTTFLCPILVGFDGENTGMTLEVYFGDSICQTRNGFVTMDKKGYSFDLED